ncbi:MAG: hypothetical protein ABUT20_04045 [Bacteroidota bacterium]
MRKQIQKTLFAYAISVLLIFHLAAQKIDSALNVLATQFPAEKIYIHYDKEYYVAGETIWFKAYLYNNGFPSLLSNNFYLQLISPDGKIISNKKYPVNGATVKGDIGLPDSLPQGYYHIRALTPGMLNTSQDFLYAKNIFVFNPTSKKGNASHVSQSPALSIYFFPESGNLVDGVASVMAFKVIDSTGMPVEINGIIKMNDSVTVAPFKTYHDGIGKIQFKPQSGKKYTAAISFNGQTQFFPLPEVQSTGINLKVEDEKGGKVFVLSRSRTNKESFDKVELVAQINNRIVYENEINFENFFSVKGHLITDGLPSGILHFTVFNRDGIPLAERLTFVDNKEYQSTAVIEVEKEGLEAKAQNILQVVFPEAAQRSCSVSITALQDNPVGNTNDIVSSLLLTEDLKGYIFNPAWYFRQQNDSTLQALDNLMLTHGWSRFSWQKILAGAFPQKIADDNYLISVSGIIKDAKTKELVSKGRLSFFLDSEDSVNQNFEVDVDASGKFVLDSLLIRGTTNFYYAYTSPQGKEKPADLYLNPVAIDSIVQNLPIAIDITSKQSLFPLLPGDENTIRKRYLSGKSKLGVTKELDPVVVKSGGNKRPIDAVNEKYTSGLFKSMGRVNIDNINDPENDRSLNVYEFIKRYIKQVGIQDGNFVNLRNFSLFAPMSIERENQKQKTLDSTNEIKGGIPPGSERYIDKADGRDPGKNYIVAIFLNESPAYTDRLKTIRMDEVALIKYYEPGFIGAGGADGPGGALAVYTKEPVTPEGRFEKLDHLTHNGYSITKEFYKPDYTITGASNKEDNRTTLYWDPEIYTSTQSKSVQLKFFNNDFSKKIRVVFEGFDATGKLIHIEKIIGN